MKLLILGTSNSILKHGWVAGLRDALPNALIENRSVGASPGVQFALAAQIDYSKYDLVFFDSVPNDQEILSLKVLDSVSKLQMWEAVLFDLCSIIASQTSLVVIGFCHRNFLFSPCAVYSSREFIARILGVQFIDVRGILNRLIETGAGTPTSLYEEHPAHVREPLAFTIGYHLGSLVSARPKLLMVTSAATSPFPDRFVNLRAEDIGLPTQLHSNSLMELRTVNLKEGYELILPESFHCLGFSLDLVRTHCCLQLLNCRKESAVDYLCYYPARKESLINVFVPVLCDGIIRSIRVAAAPGPITFRTVFSEMARISEQPIQLALSAVSLWKDSGYVPPDPERNSNTDILDISRDILARMQTDVAN